MNFRLLNFNALYVTLPGLTIFLLVSCSPRAESVNISTTTTGNSTDTASLEANAVHQSSFLTDRQIKITGRVADSDPKAKMTVDDDGYYTGTDTAPVFNGGPDSLETYIVRHIEYPTAAFKESEKIVKVQFGVNEDGNVDNVSALDDAPGFGLEEEAVKLVLNMPAWKPAKVQGKPVKTWQTLVIRYQTILDADLSKAR